MSFGYQVLGFGSGAVGPSYIVATGGTITCSGDYKMHKFTGPGTFAVTGAAGCAADNVVSYMVVAGGGSGTGSGGGAGGFREYKNSCDPYTASPLDGNPCGTAITVTATCYPITVGGGGAGQTPGNLPSPGTGGNDGNPAVFSTITSTAGGGGGQGNCGNPTADGHPGGSGGGAGNGAGSGAIGAGNTPPTTPAQGFAGGLSSPAPGYAVGMGGGGGATAVGGGGSQAPGPAGGSAGSGGAGATTSIIASPTAYAGGGGGGAQGAPGISPTALCNGGAGGGGSGRVAAWAPPSPVAGCAGEDNTGGGGGGNQQGDPSGSGGSGVVIIRYKFQ